MTAASEFSRSQPSRPDLKTEGVEKQGEEEEEEEEMRGGSGCEEEEEEEVEEENVTVYGEEEGEEAEVSDSQSNIGYNNISLK